MSKEPEVQFIRKEPSHLIILRRLSSYFFSFSFFFLVMLVVSYYLYYRNLTEIYIYCNKSAEHLSPGLSTSSSLGN